MRNKFLNLTKAKLEIAVWCPDYTASPGDYRGPIVIKTIFQ